MIFGAASCQKEFTPGQKGDCKVTFSVVIPDDITTKAISDGMTVDELKWEVYDHDNNKRLYDGTVSESAVVNGKKQFVLELNLVSNLKYDLLFWAQKSGTGYYSTGNLKNVRVTGTITANDETRDAFFGSLKNFQTGANVATQNTIILKRPFAQINIASSPSDWERAKPFIEEHVDGKEHGLKSNMIIKGVYTAFNVFDGDVIGETSEITCYYNLGPASQDYDNYPAYNEGNYIYHNGVYYGWVAMNYVFAPKDGATCDKVTAGFVHSKNTPSTALLKEIISVPFKQNYRTNILGEIFTGGNKFTVVVDASFNKPDYFIADPLMLAFEHGGNFTLKSDLNIPSSLVLKSHNKLTLDLNGYTITTTRDLWNPADGVWSMVSVQGGAELTIKDSKGTGAIIAKENDSYTFDVRDAYSKLHIEGGTFVGNISTVYVKEGTANIKGGHYSIMQLSEPANGGDERFTLNCLDENYTAGTAKINVTGGSFVNFNPANNLAEGADTRFVPAEGYAVTSVESEANGKTITTYTVAKTATVTE